MRGPSSQRALLAAAAALAALATWSGGLACRDDDTSAGPTPPAPPASPPSGWVETAAPDSPAPLAENPPDRPPAGEPGPSVTPSDSLHAEDVTPWPNVHMGQWACYKMLHDFSQRLVVTQLNEMEVQLTMEMFLDGHPAGLPAPRIENRRELSPLAEAMSRDATITFAPDQITVDGRSWPCVRATAMWNDEDLRYKQRTWFSDQAPLSGLVLQETAQGDRLVARTRLDAYGDREPREPGCP